MNTQTDQQLLQDYAESHSEPAFAELVRRYIDLVHSAALRMVCDSHEAKDVTQGVFVALAQNARQLTRHPVLSGWLHCTTRNLAANTVRTNIRRQAREQEAANMKELLSAEAGADWESIAPHLDAALGELSEPDRDALLLRFFERKSAREMAQTLGISDEAAQKRVHRAVERLRELFTKRGVTIGASGLAAVISFNAVQAAPAGLVITISSAAALTGTILAPTATKAIAMTAFQKALVAVTVAVLAGTGIYESRQASQLRSEVQTLRQQQAPLMGQIQQFKNERDDATNRLASLADEVARLNKNSAELLKLRGETPRLRTDSKELARIKAAQAQTDKSTVEAQSNFIKFVLAQTKDSLTNAVLSQLESMEKKLGTTAEQERNLKAILLDSIEPEVQAMSASLTGNQSEEEGKRQLDSLRAEKESKIVALLTPEQQIAYEDIKKQEAAGQSEFFAKSEVAAMKKSLHLSPEQTEAVASILASLPAGHGGSADATDPNARAQLEARLQALSATLTPEQLEAYRQKKLNELEQAAMAMQMFKSTGK